MKFNPGVKGDDELIRSFVARTNDFKILMDLLFAENKNVLVIGPRGAGKTTLARRVAAEVRVDPNLSKAWTPLVFAEESYEICSLGEFWLEALYRLSTEREEKKWADTYRALKKESSLDELAQKALEALKAYHKETNKKLLIVVENLSLLLDQQLDRSASIELIRALERESCLRFLGTALPSFEETSTFDHEAKRFEVISLNPLSLDDCGTLWHSIARRHLSNMQMRPVQILTGGNPRLIRILADFAGKASFRELMDDLIHLVDEHTEYFKSRLDNLPPLERKAFVTILLKWDPISARDIATETRIEITGVSPLLLRLQKRGIVSVIEGKGRNLYQATERLYNIYYLLRRGGDAPQNRVRLAVRFMVQFYRGRRLIDRARKLAIEACKLAPNQRTDHYLAYRELFNCGIPSHLEEQIRSAIPQEFLEGIPNRSRQFEESASLVGRSTIVFERGDIDEAKELLRRAIALAPQNGHAHAHLALILQEQGSVDEALNEYKLATSLAPTDYWAALRYAHFLWKRGDKEEATSVMDRVLRVPDLSERYCEQLADVLHDMDRFEESERVCLRWIAAAPEEDLARAWYDLAELYHYHLNRYPEAANAYKKRLTIENSPSVMVHYADLLERMGNKKESDRVLDSAAALLLEMPKTASVWGLLGQIRLDHLNDFEGAVDAFRKGSELDPAMPIIWADLGRALAACGILGESENALRKAISLKPGLSVAHLYLGATLHNRKQFREAAEAYQRAIELDPFDPGPLTRLGMLLEEQHNTEESVDYYSKAAALGDETAIPLLIGAKIRTVHDEALLAADLEGLLAPPLGAEVLNNAAWVISESNKPSLLQLAEKTVRRATSLEPRDYPALHTLATILAKLEKWEEALALCRELVSPVAQKKLALQDFTKLIIEAAAAGFSEQCLSLLRGSKAAASMEPLIVALEMHLGIAPVVAQEIFEVAKDIEKEIAQRCSEAVVGQLHSPEFPVR